MKLATAGFNRCFDDTPALACRERGVFAGPPQRDNSVRTRRRQTLDVLMQRRWLESPLPVERGGNCGQNARVFVFHAHLYALLLMKIRFGRRLVAELRMVDTIERQKQRCCTISASYHLHKTWLANRHSRTVERFWHWDKPSGPQHCRDTNFDAGAAAPDSDMSAPASHDSGFEASESVMSKTNDEFVQKTCISPELAEAVN